MIDTNNEMQVRNYKDKLKIISEQVNTNGYTEDDLKIVISLNMFPANRTVLPAGKESYVYKNPNCSLGIVVRDRIKKVDGINEYDDEKLATLKVQSEKYMPYNSKYVSVVYAAINGLYPDFYAPNFIVVDSFKQHASNKSILSMRPETTLFTGEIQLTSEAVFLINQKNIDEFNQKYPELTKFKVIPFTGDPEMALHMYLVTIGIVPEKMTLEYVADSPTSYKFNEFINAYSLEKNIKLSRYDETEFYESDQVKTQKLQAIYDSTFYEYLLKGLNVTGEHYDELYKRLCEGDSYDPDNLIILDGIIDTIGAKGLESIVNEFNSKIDHKIKEKIYPVNEEILEKGKIDLN